MVVANVQNCSGVAIFLAWLRKTLFVRLNESNWIISERIFENHKPLDTQKFANCALYVDCKSNQQTRNVAKITLGKECK